jgi:hypothetical protein
MAQEVYKNNDGQVLFGNSGNIFRKPFDFGNAFTTESANSYLKVDLSSLSINESDITVIGWMNNDLSSGDKPHICLRSGLNSYRWYRQGPSGNGILFKNTSVVLGSGFLEDPGFFGIGYQKAYKNESILTQTPILSDVSNISDLLIGAYSTTAGGGLLYSPVNGKVGYLYVFNRQLSDDEIKYLYNNRIGSSPLSENGLIAEYELNKAEVLNEGAGDFAGVNNLKGSTLNLRFFNLPAGTPQEQVDYANANLFTPFI